MMNHPNVNKQSGSIPSSEDLPIYYDLYMPKDAGEEPIPVILFVHGFKGFKDWGAFPDACAELSAAGFGVVAFNLSLNGVGESMTEFDELHLFARETLSQDLNDVGSVIAALDDGSITPQNGMLDVEKMGIVGHSRGGHTAVAAAAEYPEIVCLVTWSAVADYNAHWSDQMIADWDEHGVTEIMNGRTGQVMPVNDVVYEDALENEDRLMAIKRIEELELPSLFVHSKGDQGVSYNEAEKLYKHSQAEDKKLELMPDSGHTFGTAHPFEADEFPETFRNVLEETSQWFVKHLQ